MGKQSKIILISGPTAAGKSYFSIKIAKKINGEIINADSIQVYKHLKVLTARPSLKERKKIKHHLYGFVNCNEKFSTGQWLKEVIKKIKEIKKRKKIPIIVGGTGLYFKALTDGLVKIPKISIKNRTEIRLLQRKYGQKKFYNTLLKLDPKVENKFDPNDVQRSVRAYEIKKYTKISMYDWLNKTKSKFNENDFVKYYINFERQNLIKRIEKRTVQMLNSGALNEVKRFNKLKVKKDHSINKVIGLNELKRHLNKEISLDEAKELIIIKTRQYAKRQTTWARNKMYSWRNVYPHSILSEIRKLKI